MHSLASLIQGHFRTTPIAISALENITLRQFRNQKLHYQPTRGTIVIQGRRIQIVPKNDDSKMKSELIPKQVHINN